MLPGNLTTGPKFCESGLGVGCLEFETGYELVNTAFFMTHTVQTVEECRDACRDYRECNFFTKFLTNSTCITGDVLVQRFHSLLSVSGSKN